MALRISQDRPRLLRAQGSSAGRVVLLVAIWLGCGGEAPSPERAASTPRLPAEETPAPSAPAAVAPAPSGPELLRGSEAAMLAPTPPPTPTLDELMRLPADVGRVDPVTGRPTRKPAPTDSSRPASSRVRLELEQREDTALLRPSVSRSRTDAGVSVDVADKVKLRGGVRLEEASNDEPDDAMPTVGIEKRF